MSTTWRSLWEGAVLATDKTHDSSTAPIPVAGLDIRSLPIGPEEAFILSRVDGRATATDIAKSTGLEAPRVSELLKRLATLGALTLEGHGVGGSAPEAIGPNTAPADPRGQSAAAEAESSPRAGINSSPVEMLGSWPRKVAGAKPLYDPSELEQPGDLPPERKKWILDLYYQLHAMDHYTILDVPRSAQKKDVKAAYFRLVSVLHPDRYFGKQLDSFKPKLEKCFQRVTDAHDTLTKKKARAAYDRYLESRGATRDLDQLDDAEAVEEQLASMQREIEAEAQQRAVEPTIPPAVHAPLARPTAAPDQRPWSEPPFDTVSEPPFGAVSESPFDTVSEPPFDTVSEPPPILQHGARPSLTPEQRRRALARKLRTTTPSPGRPSHAPAAASLQQRREAAAEALRRRYESRLRDVIEQRLQRYLDQADQAERTKNIVAAANALRIAVQLSPDNVLLRERFERVEQQASEVLAEKYVEQAKYEEQNGYLLEASRTYEKAARGRPVAPIFEKAALCQMAGNGDLKHAAELARKAVDLAPRSVGYRMTLATLYAKAGMEKSALAELERAKTLAPSNDSIQELVKRIKRGEL